MSRYNRAISNASTTKHEYLSTARNKLLTRDHIIREASERISRLTEVVGGASAERNPLVITRSRTKAFRNPGGSYAKTGSWWKPRTKVPGAPSAPLGGQGSHGSSI
jgi:hypothetical protein